VIILTRLGGHALAVNPDLIERAEATPDTVITMIDGHKMVVAESLEEVVDLVRTWRATVAAQAFAISRQVEQLDDDPAEDLPGLGPDGRSQHPSMRGRRRAGSDAGTGAPAGRELSAHTAISQIPEASLARVLRMPPRGE